MLGQLIHTIFVIVLFIISLPLQCLIAMVVAITTGGPIFFTQQRVGRDGTPFLLYKFRTMNRGAEKKQKQLKHLNEATGPAFKIHHDPRFTPIGKLLSHTGLDELPQLWNVLRGEMSVIGPRPLPIEEAKKLHHWQQERHSIKPGIISPWVLNGYHSNSFDEWMKSDIIYAKQKSVSGDMILFINAFFFWIHLIFKQSKELLNRL